MLKSILHYSKSQRIGIILLFLIIVILQGIYFFVDLKPSENTKKEKTTWLANQNIIDSVKLQQANYKPTIYPFNPNFITDFKGYKLGMSVEEIDRLLAFRKQNKFVNSASEFQAVTKVSDSLLKAISPYFKFPDWVQNKKNNYQHFEKKNDSKAEKVIILDINEASKEDLMKVYGIGDKISDRILTEKEKYGAFVSMEQMNDIWGLSTEVIENLNKHFKVKSAPKIKRININNASVKELSQFPFFRYALAKDIVIYRSMNGDIKTEDLSKIKGFPIDKIKIIALYLEF
ncbi:MAG: helix-hairpin-helix domain-containing protein [Flavobacterium sp.]|nr:helix-hairpin-helix domain-containing protein [Flavobacterium sp.]